MYNFKNKIALVTGATGGIGNSIAYELIANGAIVIAVGRNKDKLEEFSQFSNDAHAFEADLSDSDEVQRVVDETINKFNKIDFLITAAGITRDNLSIKMSLEEFDEVINLNLRSVFYINKLVLKEMRRAKYGKIVNISSVIAHCGNIGQVNYSASKAGVIGMTKSFAREYAKHVNINSIAPGYIKSEMTDKLNDNVKAKILESVPRGEIGKCEDVAKAAMYLCSDDAKYITGETLNVNGGMLMI